MKVGKCSLQSGGSPRKYTFSCNSAPSSQFFLRGRQCRAIQASIGLWSHANVTVRFLLAVSEGVGFSRRRGRSFTRADTSAPPKQQPQFTVVSLPRVGKMTTTANNNRLFHYERQLCVVLTQPDKFPIFERSATRKNIAATQFNLDI